MTKTSPEHYREFTTCLQAKAILGACSGKRAIATLTATQIQKMETIQ